MPPFRHLKYGKIAKVRNFKVGTGDLVRLTDNRVGFIATCYELDDGSLLCGFEECRFHEKRSATCSIWAEGKVVVLIDMHLVRKCLVWHKEEANLLLSLG